VFLINGFTKGDWLEAFYSLCRGGRLDAEMLPMIVTVNLARARWRCRKKA